MAIPTQTIMPSPTPSNLRKRSKETPPSGGRTAPPPASVQSVLVGSDDTSPRTAQAEVVALAGIAALRRGLSVKVESEKGEEDAGGVVCVEVPGDDVAKGEEASELSAAGALLALVAGDERTRGGAGGGGGCRDGGGGRPKKRARQLDFSPVYGADSARNGVVDSGELKGAHGKRNGGARAPFDKASSGAVGLLIVTSDLSAGSPMSVGSKGRICNCKNSRCLKLYCEI
jgi:hypothetical protein